MDQQQPETSPREGDEATMMEDTLEKEDIVDETPEFLTADGQDAVEVQVDDNDVPMDDDDDDGEEGMQEAERSIEPPPPDMSRATINAHTGCVYAVASSITANKLTIVSGGGDDKAMLHQVNGSDNSTASVPLSHVHTDTVSCVALNIPYISSDHNQTPPLAAAGGYDGALLVYDPISGSLVHSFEGPTDVEWCCFHPKGGTVLLAGSSADGTVWMYHVLLKKCLQVFVGHEAAVTSGNFSADGKWAVSVSSDGTLRVWAPRTGVCRQVFRFQENAADGQPVAGLTCLAVGGGSDGQLVMTGGEDGRAHVCHIGSKKVVASLRHYEVPATMDEEMELPMSVEAVGFFTANSTNWCATGGVDGVLKVWDLSIGGGQCRQACKVSTDTGNPVASVAGGVTRLTWHPTLPLVVASYTNGSIRLWDARNGQCLHTLTTGTTDVVNDMNAHFPDPNRAVIVAAGDDNAIRVLDIDIGTAAL